MSIRRCYSCVSTWVARLRWVVPLGPPVSSVALLSTSARVRSVSLLLGNGQRSPLFGGAWLHGVSSRLWLAGSASVWVPVSSCVCWSLLWGTGYWSSCLLACGLHVLMASILPAGRPGWSLAVARGLAVMGFPIGGSPVAFSSQVYWPSLALGLWWALLFVWEWGLPSAFRAPVGCGRCGSVGTVSPPCPVCAELACCPVLSAVF